MPGEIRALLERLWFDVLVRDVITLGGYMLIGGAVGLYIRALYRRFAGTVSGRDATSRVFPLLTVATVLVISVVKSSLALSLGLVGALSIVRFRAAIKEPEELVYLFFCVAIGLALGAESLTVAAVGTLVFTIFVLGSHRGRNRGGGDQPLLLTISGGVGDGGGSTAVTSAMDDIAAPYTLQRLDVDGDEVQLRAVVEPESQGEIGPMLAALRERLPECRISYVNLETLL